MIRFTILTLSVLLPVAPAAGQSAPITRHAPWADAATQAFRRLPVQDGDRVKPLSTALSLILLQCNGKRSVRVPNEARFGDLAGRSLAPTEWGMDLLFHPEQADLYPCFEVPDSVVLEDLGRQEIIKARRARYSFAELEPAAKELITRGRQLQSIPSAELTALQRQQLRLCSSFALYSRLRMAGDFARVRFEVSAPIGLKQAFDGQEEVRFSAFVERLPRVIALWEALRRSPGAAGRGALRGVLQTLARTLSASNLLRLTPPVTRDNDGRWPTIDELARATDLPEVPDLTAHLEYLRRFEATADAVVDATAFASRATELQAQGKRLAVAAGSYGPLELEDRYNRLDLFYRGLYGFLFSFLVAAVAWLFPRRRWPWWVVNTSALVSLGLVIAGIWMRCVIRGRPPVTNLYETVLFVTAGAVSLALVMELVNRRRVAASVGSLVGVAGLFVAHRYELHEVSDTMTPLVAVLDTNFWLATHVTAVTMGYLAGLLAGALAAVYLIGKLFVRGDRHYGAFHDIARMVYGTLCFGALFATLGTVLGGIWANESWGRFWGWDPKENGALLIVIYMLFILHGRLGGYFKDFGVCTLAVLGNAVVAWSWWGVNELNTGLHSYGSISGVSKWLMIFYAANLGIVLPGLVLKLLARFRRPPTALQG